MMLTESEEQQLTLMKQRIHCFEQAPASLDSLLSITQSLEEILDSLKSVDEHWKEAFRTEWWELEFTSSVMMDQEVDDLTDEDKEAVSLALQNMKIMIDKALEEKVR